MKSPISRMAGSNCKLIHTILTDYIEVKPTVPVVEPFAGTASFSFIAGSLESHINDTDSNVINLHRYVRAQPEQIQLNIKEREYYITRRTFNERRDKGTSTSVETGKEFYKLVQYSYNGLVRYNSKGEFNVPYGVEKELNENLQEPASLMKEWCITCRDFDELTTTKKQLVFVDPPFSFSVNNHNRLISWLSKHKGNIIALIKSNLDQTVLDEYNKLLPNSKELSRVSQIRDAASRVKLTYKLMTNF